MLRLAGTHGRYVGCGGSGVERAEFAFPFGGAAVLVAFGDVFGSVGLGLRLRGGLSGFCLRRRRGRLGGGRGFGDGLAATRHAPDEQEETDNLNDSIACVRDFHGTFPPENAFASFPSGRGARVEQPRRRQHRPVGR